MPTPCYQAFSIQDIHKICNQHWHNSIRTKQILSNQRLEGSYSRKYSNNIHKVVSETVDSKSLEDNRTDKT